MKKFFLFAALALLAMSCDKTEVLNVDNGLTNDSGIKFEAYTPQTAVTKAGTPGDIDNANIGTIGFGVFAYYTAGETYDVNAKPNFMYNQLVLKGDDGWTYEPVKYWPNEYGNAAQSDEIDYVSFFSYAPWTDFEPTTGAVKADNEHDQNYNIISVNKNSATGDPIIKYVVDTDPATSVDLLWGVAAPVAETNYSSINPTQAPSKVKAGMPFIDLVKPGNPIEDKISFNLKHSLAKVKFTIDYIKDDFTPDSPVANFANKINEDQTRIFVRSFTIDGWATEGALNLNNTEPGEPLWLDIDGVKDLNFEELTFNDGRKDNGKEGTENGAQNNEENKYLNPDIIENFAAVSNNKFPADKNPGVTNEPQLLFGGDDTKNGGYFYVIPRNDNTPVNVKIVYDVETIDPALSGLISDGMTHGISIENIISKNAILGDGKDFEAGKQYLIKIHLGMTSVKIEAVVTAWDVQNDEEVDLPDNQPMPCWTVDGVPGYFTSDPAAGFTWDDAVYIIKDSASFTAALADKYSELSRYYDWCDNGGDTGEDFSHAGSARFNYSLGIYDDQYTGGYRNGAAWEADGFKRCYKGHIQDDPRVKITIDPTILCDGAELILVKGDREIELGAYPDDLPTFLYYPLADTELPTDNSDGTYNEEIKAKVKYPADAVRYHETIK